MHTNTVVDGAHRNKMVDSKSKTILDLPELCRNRFIMSLVDRWLIMHTNTVVDGAHKNKMVNSAHKTKWLILIVPTKNG